VERSLELLLATPATDGEILLGKSIAAAIPALVATFIAVEVFMTLSDIITVGILGYLYYPTLTAGLILLVIAPLAVVLSVELNVLVSARVNDVRTATQIGSLAVLPFGAISVGSEIGLVPLNTTNLLIIIGVLIIVVLALFTATRATFHREEILTKWK
jgi:ABC-2 type transport system permease protein